MPYFRELQCGLEQAFKSLVCSLEVVKGSGTSHALRSETKTRRIANLLTITGNYRELWKEFFHTLELARVIDPAADVIRRPVTPTEELFVGLVIAQMSSVYYATQDELLIKLEGSRRDIAEFISLPIPNSVWTKTKLLQNQDFAAFIESSLQQL